MRWPLQPLQPLQQTQLQPPFGQSVASLCHPWFTTTNVSYRFPIFETSATALCGTTGILYYAYHILFMLYNTYIFTYIHICSIYLSYIYIRYIEYIYIYTMNTDRGRSTVKPWLTTIFKLQARLPDRQQKTALSSRLAQLKTSSAARQLASLDSRASRGIVFDCMMHIHCTILCNVTFSYVSVCVYLSATIYLYI